MRRAGRHLCVPSSPAPHAPVCGVFALLLRLFASCRCPTLVSAFNQEPFGSSCTHTHTHAQLQAHAVGLSSVSPLLDMAIYFAMLSLMDVRFLRYKRSVVAASCLHLAAIYTELRAWVCLKSVAQAVTPVPSCISLPSLARAGAARGDLCNLHPELRLSRSV